MRIVSVRALCVSSEIMDCREMQTVLNRTATSVIVFVSARFKTAESVSGAAAKTIVAIISIF